MVLCAESGPLTVIGWHTFAVCLLAYDVISFRVAGGPWASEKPTAFLLVYRAGPWVTTALYFVTLIVRLVYG